MTLGRPGALLAARYRLDRLMGSTGSAERWQAYDERLARPVMARLSLAAGDAAYEEVTQAALERLAGLNHPGVAAVYDVGITDELGDGAGSADSAAGAVSYAISEWTTGRTLGQIMATGPQPWPRVADWGRQISGALAALHSLGIVHGALGPNSVAIHDDRQVKILDPGLGSAAEQSDEVSGEAAAESAARDEGPAGAAGDVYALGLLLCEAGVGAGDGDEDDVQKPKLAGWRESGAPAELTALLAQMLDGDPARRPTAAVAQRRFVPFAAVERVGDTLPEMPAATTQGSMARRTTDETHVIVPTPEVGLARPTAVTQRVGPPSGAAARAAEARAAAEREHRRRRGMLIGLVLLLAAIGTGVGLLIANLHPSNAANPGTGDTAVPSVSPGTVTLPSASASPSPSQASTSAAPPSSHPPSRSPSPTRGSSSPSASASSSPSSTTSAAAPSSAPASRGASSTPSGASGSPAAGGPGATHPPAG
jgi:eukaryotic-like serine/threonine-protein kinase